MWPHGLAGVAPDQDATLIDLATLRSSGAVLRAMVRRDPLKFSLGALGAALVSVANVSIPLAMGRAVQVGLVDHRFSGFALWLGVVALAYLLRAGATTLRLHSNMSASMLQHDMRVQALARTVDPTGLGSARRLPGDLLTVMITDARTTSRALVALTGVPGQLVTLIGALVALLLIDWRLSVAVLVLTPLLVLMSLKGLAPIQERTRAERRAEAAAAGIAADLTEGLRVVQGLGASARASSRFRTASQTGLAATLRTRTARGIYNAVVSGAVGIFTALLTLLGAVLALNGQITIGALVTVVGLGQTLAPPLRSLGVDTASTLASARASADRVRELVATPPAQQFGTADEPPAGPVHLELRGVTTPTITVPLNLAVPPGRQLGMVGPEPVIDELAALVARERRPATGQLLVDARPAAEWSDDGYRARVLAAPREPELFDGTLRENLTLAPDGPLQAEADKALDAAIWASASGDTVAGLPAGVDEMIGEGGQELSGGQRQRIALARALLHADDLLMLVEPTTSVDPITDREIAERMREFRAGRTTMVACSSANELAQADEVVFFGEDGAIIARGPHESLLALDAYREVLS